MMDTKKLRQKILDLAIRGKLVPQNPNDEPASVLLERIRAEKERLIKEGKIKRSKKSASDTPHYENRQVGEANEVPFEVPESWEWTTLGEITNYGNCENVDVNDIPSKGWILELEDLEKDSAKIIQRLTKDERDIKGVRHSFHKGDVLYSKLRTYLNKVLVADEDGFCTTEIIPVTSMASVLPEYLNYVLRSKYFVDYTVQCGYGVKMPRLSTTDACNGQIPLPPYNEQKHIVASIEGWFQIIDLLETAKEDLQTSITQAKSKILDLAIHGKLVPQDPNDEPAIELLKRINPKFVPCDNAHDDNQLPNSWCWTTLGSIFQHNTGKALNKSDSQEGLLKPYLTTSNVYWNCFDFTEVKEMHFKDSELEKCTITKGDLLVCEGGDIGRAAIWNYDYDICIQNHIHRLRAKGNVCQILYLYILMLYKWKDRIHGKGIGLQGLSSGLLDKLVVPLPPINEQLRIVAKIEELFAVLDEIQKSIEA